VGMGGWCGGGRLVWGWEAGASSINYLKMLGQNSFITIIIVVVDYLDQPSNCISAWNAGCYFGGLP